MELNYDHFCFGCGEKNPKGLKLKFRQEGDIVRTTFVPDETHQGYPGIIHGGITSTIFDEVMSTCINMLGEFAVTARLEVRFKNKIHIKKPIEFEAKIVKRKGRVIDVEARAFLEGGKTAAEAKGRFIIIKEEDVLN
ncbi:MAG: PaaI family thioesterase [Clostridia bacterium]|nr:PaaI family thioesterase [Clostridia bacterium]MDD4047573.1 PaaI family thioesterase [Clostridia bacterium]